MNILDTKAYQYAYHCAYGNDDKVGKYVRKQCKVWCDICEGKIDYAYIDEDKADMIIELLKIINFPDAPQYTMYEKMIDYQWLFIIAVLCTMDNNGNRLYATGLLEISRKNFKTFTSGIIFIIEMLIEPEYSRFYSVAPDYKLSSELKVAVRKLIGVSPAIQKYFKVKRDMVECKLTNIEYTPLAYSNDGMDGKLANVFLADEAGLLDDYPVEAMRSSQITLENKLGIIISTQYPNDDNVMLTEIDLAKRILDGYSDKKNYFALLYEPNEEIINEWETNDLVIYQSNPSAVQIPAIFDNILEKREMAILYESKRENYLCKHNNIKYKSVGVEGYINSEQIQKCRTNEEWDWNGKPVYIGLDFAESDDNTSVAMIGWDDYEEKIMAKVWCFVPNERVEAKSIKENVNYNKYIEAGNCYACGDDTINYQFIEDFVLNLENEYGVEIINIGYDIRNARPSAQRFEREGYSTTEVKQHSSELHPSIKWLKEMILNKKFSYYDNELLEINFTNCRQTEDTNLNKYINKRVSVKTAGKIDMVFATIDAVHLLWIENLSSEYNWTIQR